ncbi:MAG: hypothetical protein ABJA57_04755 [Ginsengibacter sp.]
MADITTNFIKLIGERSSVDNSLLSSLLDQNLYAQAIAILSQDIDSLLRVAYLLTIGDRTERNNLMESMVKGEEWKSGKKNTSGTDMAATVVHYNKWISEVFDFGNLFSNITDHHDLKKDDPLVSLSSIQKTTMRYYLSTYHQFSYDMQMTFLNVSAYLPKVAAKVSSNLKRNMVDLENNRQH